jgi:hypothetical protein
LKERVKRSVQLLTLLLTNFSLQTVAVGVIKSTTAKEAAGVTTKAAQKVCRKKPEMEIILSAV